MARKSTGPFLSCLGFARVLVSQAQLQFCAQAARFGVVTTGAQHRGQADRCIAMQR
jgi:hypothetical protein